MYIGFCFLIFLGLLESWWIMYTHIYIYIHKCHLIERAKVVSVSASLTMEATSSRVFWAEVTPHDFVPKICGSLGVMLRTSNSYGLYKFVYLYRKWIHWHTLHYIKLYTSKARYVFPKWNEVLPICFNLKVPIELRFRWALFFLTLASLGLQFRVFQWMYNHML